MKLPQEPNAARAFRNLGLALLVVGGLVAYAYSRDKANLDAQDNARLTMLITALASGICFISAAAKWFIKR